MKELVDILNIWRERRAEPFALATLVRARGSSYRRPGARMLICGDGLTVGSLSGGCLEEEVIAAAREVMRTGIPKMLNFDTRLRFGCNGSIEVFVERLSERFLRDLDEHFVARRSCTAITRFSDGAQRGSFIVDREVCALAGSFVQRIESPIHLLVFGDGPDSLPLRSFAETLGWNVFETENASELPQNADQRTAAIVKSHNYGRDFAALRHLLALDLPYVGLMGPRARRDQLLHALLDDGFEIRSELFAPAGFDLNAETPEEIALAIIAEIQGVLGGGSGESLRDRKQPIHGWNIARPAPAPTVAAECETSAR